MDLLDEIDLYDFIYLNDRSDRDISVGSCEENSVLSNDVEFEESYYDAAQTNRLLILKEIKQKEEENLSGTSK